MNFPRRIPEPKTMESLEMREFYLLSRANFSRWILPLIDAFVKETGVKKGIIIDAACGPGVLSEGLGKHSQRYQVIGVDISTPALRIARKNCKGIKNVEFRKGSVYKLPFKENYADAVICKDSFHHFDNPKKALTEMLRIIKPGGYLFIQDLRRDLPSYLVARARPRQTVIQKLQYYSTRAAYTKKEIRGLLASLKLRPQYLGSPRLSKLQAKKYLRGNISRKSLNEGLISRYNVVIRK